MTGPVSKFVTERKKKPFLKLRVILIGSEQPSGQVSMTTVMNQW
jgi:hypothetical protein